MDGVCVQAMRPSALTRAVQPEGRAAAGGVDALTLALTAPECLLGAEEVSSASTLLWSLGVLLHTLLVGEPPFAARSAPQLLQLIFSGGGGAHPRLSASTSAFLGCLLRPDPTKRLPAAQALEHAWLAAPPAEAEPVYSEAHARDATAHHAPRALLQALHARLRRCHVDQLLERCGALAGHGDAYGSQ